METLVEFERFSIKSCFLQIKFDKVLPKDISSIFSAKGLNNPLNCCV